MPISAVLPRPPVVTILGHVDHGKTSLLDTIRKTNIVSKEFGGITQHIGAYQIEVSPKGELSSRAIPSVSRESRGIPSKHKEEILLRQLADQDDFAAKNCKITFIDTPGHEAFAKMRSRGANVSDLAVLVVAGNDGVMPQTIESLEHIKTAKIPFIVAVNKIDLPDINLEKIKKQLVKLGIKLEEYGGETPLVPLSAKTGEGVPRLLEMIILLAELHQLQDTSFEKFKAVVIESVLSKNKGPVATVVVRSGILKEGEEVVCENQEFRIRALHDWLGKNLNQIKAGDPAEILGWKKLPAVGSILFNKHQVELTQLSPANIMEVSAKNLAVTEEQIKLIIKADTAGTLEAIQASLLKNTLVLESGVGNINESDILLAKTSKALIIGFHVKPSEDVRKLAESEKVIIKTYNIIYELIDEIDEVVEALKKGNLVNILGEAKVIALFKIKDQAVAGVKVIKGRIARGDQVKIMRKDEEVGRTRIKSLRHKKEDITKSEQGSEAGVMLFQDIEILTGDSIISIG